jgi:UDPglucose--hexose-1-phosphate uridylyltransferase
MSDALPLQNQPHRRFNPLICEWVLVSPHRAERPWQGQTEKPAEPAVEYDPECYLCPGNQRVGGNRNPRYGSTFVFDNDYASLKPGEPVFSSDPSDKGLQLAEAENGICRVVCFSPRHDLTLSRMSADAVAGVVEVWTEQYRQLGDLPSIKYVQVFENRGAIMGCSNPHPHGQIWANSSIPNEPRKEQQSFLAYQQKHGSCLLCDYVGNEMKAAERIVCANDDFVAVVPFWATWPFETMVLPTLHVGRLTEMSNDQRTALADILKRLTTRYDNLFETSFPYSLGLHQSPTDGESHPEWHFHAHFYPPLLRSATVKKFMVGYELLAMPQRDLTPEAAATRLAALSEVHYLLRK